MQAAKPDYIALLISGAPTFIVAVSGLITVIYKLNEVHKAVNSRLDQLVLASKAQGRQDERDAHSVTVAGVPAKEQDGPL
jgi:hypothetical protein